MKNTAYIGIITILLLGLLLTACGNSQTATTTSPSTSTSTSVTTQPLVATSTPATTAPASPTAGTPQYGGVLKVYDNRPAAIIGYPPELTCSGCSQAAAICLETLVGSDSSGNFRPSKLSTAYQVAEDGKSVTFTLRKGVKFHDGTDWNAQAAKWNLDAILKVGTVPGTSSWTSVDVVDEYTVRINIKAFEINMIANLSGYSGLMCSPTAVEKNGIPWAEVNPVGTGPFKFVSFQKGVSVKYERFDGYWGGKPYLDGVEVVYFSDATAAGMAFESGNLDVFTASGNQAKDLMAKGYPYTQQVGSMTALFPDSANANSPFADKRVREAAEYCIDRKSISQALGFGLWNPMNQPCPDGFMGYVPDLQARSYNLDKAKSLLKEAGYTTGPKIDIVAQTTFDKDTLVAVQTALNEAGFDAQLNIMSPAAWKEADTKGWTNGFQFKPMGCSDPYISTLNMFFRPKSGYLFSTSRPPGLADALDKALAAHDFKTANSFAQNVVKMLQEDAMCVPLWTASSYLFKQKYVNGIAGTYMMLGDERADWSRATVWLKK